MNEKLLLPYNPQRTEDRLYTLWEKSGFFNPDICIEKGITEKNAPHFSIVLPPPNVTGTLHMGSAYMLALEDTMTRFARMQGKRTLWLPGTDHAAIATQSKVEKMIQKEEGKNRHDLGRQEFLKRVDTFANQSHDTIVNQMKKMGCSVDWSREAFTLDNQRNFAVRTAFKRMYDDGIIYRAHRIVNWDPKGQTTISDDEIVYEQRKSTLYTFKYTSDFPIAISTTQPETKVGDTAVAVHPSDVRYTEHVGKTYTFNFCGETLSIQIVADDSVDPTFGTGALGVTPAHSQIDWDIAQRHSLPVKPVINEYAKMTVSSPLLAEKKTIEARESIVAYLQEHNLLISEETIEQNVPTAERTGGIIQPLPKLQWFIAVNKEFTYKHENLSGVKKGELVTLKKLMLSVVNETHSIDILPDRFEKVYTHWIENLRDWCISRQIWYGHQIPVWYRDTEIYCDITPPTDTGWVQDTDTLDTWFSSGLWSFSTLGWPESTPDLATYHPTTILETGYDIIFFWVARMILMSTYLIGQIPFNTVYLHGLVRDKDGKKISKSLGNNIDPIDMIHEYGADAVRMALIIGTGPGNDTRVSVEKCKAYKHFANKLWNITRFVTTAGDKPDTQPTLTPLDEQKITELNTLVEKITKDMEEYNLYLAGEKLYHYIWHRFADEIIEETKPVLAQGSNSEKQSSLWMLHTILSTSLKTLHPFMPFITEELWSMLNNAQLLLVEKWPVKT